MKKVILLFVILGFALQSFGQEQKSYKEKNYVPISKIVKYVPKDRKLLGDSIVKVNIVFNAKGDTISYQSQKLKKTPKEKQLLDVEKSLNLDNSQIGANLQVMGDKIMIYPWLYYGVDVDSLNQFFKENDVYIKMEDRINYNFKYSSYQLGIVTLPLKWYMDSKLGNVETSINAMVNAGYKWGKSRFIKFPYEEKAREYKTAFSFNLLAGISKIELNKINTSEAEVQIEEANIAAISLAASFGIHYGNFIFMPTIGFDIPTSNRKDWNFSGTPWLGIGVGYNFLKFN